MANRPWTEAEETLLEELRMEGLNCAAIAKVLGRTKWAVERHASRLAVPKFSPRRARWIVVLTNPHTIKNAMAELGVSKSAVVQMKIELRRAGYPVVRATQPAPVNSYRD